MGGILWGPDSRGDLFPQLEDRPRIPIQLRLLPNPGSLQRCSIWMRPFRWGLSPTVLRQLTIKQEAAFGCRPNGLGSRAQDKNIQLERQAPN